MKNACPVGQREAEDLEVQPLRSIVDKAELDHGTSCSPVLGVLPFPSRCFRVCGAAQWSNIGCTWRAI